MFESLLAANRGEITRRVIRSARTLGIRTIAVHSCADAELPLVAEADETVELSRLPAQACRDASQLPDIARKTSAEAITAMTNDQLDDRTNTDITWIDNSPSQSRHDIAEGAQQRQENRMRSRALLGIGTLFIITLATVIIAPGVGVITEDFARTLAQMIIPVLLAAATTIIGCLFRPPP